MKKSLVVAILLAGAVFAWRSLRSAQDAGEETLTRHLWLDRMPDDQRTMVQAFIAVKQRRQAVGLFHHGSAFKIAQEFFSWSASRGALVVEYPQTGEREQVTYRITPCREEGFTLCMELKGNTRGVRKYRSNEDLEIDGETAPDAALARVLVRQAAR